MRARAWHLVAIGALAPLPIFINWGCQGTCQATSDCPDTDYCSIATGACLGPRALGFCKPKPESCPQVISQVCGCDGQTFINACEAARAGVPIASDPPCQVACGGPSATTCPEGSFCQYADSVCAMGMAYGQCQTKPVTCDPADNKKVCGCDGKTYASECLAQQASVSIAMRTSCEAADGGTGGGGGGGGSGGGDGGTLTDIKLLITEVRSHGKDGDKYGDEFVEIYNPNDTAVTVDDTWLLRYRNAQGGCTQGEEIRFQGQGQVIPAHGHLLIVGLEYQQMPPADAMLINNSPSFSLGDAANLYLFRNNKVVDAVCWYFDNTSLIDMLTCNKPYVCEGGPMSNAPHCGTTSPTCSVDASIRRKTDMMGNVIDTDDNEADFESAIPSTPENLASPPTP